MNRCFVPFIAVLFGHMLSHADDMTRASDAHSAAIGAFYEELKAHPKWTPAEQNAERARFLAPTVKRMNEAIQKQVNATIQRYGATIVPGGGTVGNAAPRKPATAEQSPAPAKQKSKPDKIILDGSAIPDEIHFQSKKPSTLKIDE